MHTLLHSDDYPLNTYCRNWRTPCGIGFELEKKFSISTMYAKEQTIADPDKPYNPSGEGQPKWSEVAYSPVFKSGVGGASWAYMIDQPAVCRKRC